VDEPTPVRGRLEQAGVAVDTVCHAMATMEEKVGYVIEKIRREHIRVVVACQDTAFAYHVFYHLGTDGCRLIEHGGIEAEVGRIPKDFTARYIGVSTAIATAAAGRMQESSHALAIPSMVDLVEFEGRDRGELRQGYGIPAEACVVVFVGRLDPKKRVEHLVVTAEALLSRNAHVHFLVIGPLDAFAADYGHRLIQQAQPLTATGRFVITGPRSDTAQILCMSDILVLPGTGEGMSHVINEAGAAGLAVVATDDGAAREQLEDGQAGVLVNPGSPEALTAVLQNLIDDPDRCRLLGARLRTRVQSRYGHTVVVPQWEQVIAEVAAEVPKPTYPTLPVIRQDELLPFPLEIQIQTNTLCNASCIMCPYPEVSKEFPHSQMEQELYEEILAQCSREGGLRRLEPFLMNEPFTDRRLVDWIAMAKERVPQAWVTVTTNGTLVRPVVSDRLVQSGLDAIWFSFNGATKETYEKIMGCSYDTVVRNIDYLLAIRPPSLQVFTNMIETVPMQPEIAENIRRWVERGVGSGSSKLVNRAGNVRNFTELNYTPLHSEPVRLCDLLFHKMYILYNGDVVLCCMDWRRQVIMGNVKQQSLREIWHGERYTHYRRLHEEGRSKELQLCSTCSYIYN
jgi:radical SAM protein with 4Fe4S-binding SPASM domain